VIVKRDIMKKDTKALGWRSKENINVYISFLKVNKI